MIKFSDDRLIVFGVAIKAPKGVTRVTFRKSNLTNATIDTVNHNLLFEYKPGTTSNQLPDLFIEKRWKDEKLTDCSYIFQKVSKVGDMRILCSNLLEDYNHFYLSTFLDYKDHTQALECHIEDLGVYFIIPSEKVGIPINTIAEIENYINSSQDFIKILGMKSAVNILGLDILEGRLVNYLDTVPYSVYHTFYLNEPIIIGSFIEHCRELYPEIQFYNIPSQRDNTNRYKEFIRYDSDVQVDHSHIFNSNLVESAVYGTMFKSTIPIRFTYESPSSKYFIDRRNQFLTHKFLDFTEYNFEIEGEEFSVAVHWTREIENDIQQVQDMSDRSIYAFNMQLYLIAIILEKNIKPDIIENVIASIYGKVEEDYADK